MFVFDIFTFNIFAFDIFPFDIFPFDIFPFDIFTIQIHFYNIPKNPQMCPARRDLPTPSHPHSRLNLPHPIPQHTDTSQQNSHPPQPSTQKKPEGCAEGRGFVPLCGFLFSQKKRCISFAKERHTAFFQKYFFTFCYFTTRTLYIPSISLSSSNALADAALSRSIRV